MNCFPIAAERERSMSFGFSVACSVRDYPFACACISSIRCFAPDAPVSLTVDESGGRVDTRRLEQTYQVSVIRAADVRDPGLRSLSFGYGITKMIAFWEAPFDVILHIDADAVMWGDIRRNLSPDPWDLVFNEPHETISSYIQKTQYFDPERVFSIVPRFAWEARPYFNCGVICMKRGSLDLDEYLRMLQLQKQHPELLITGEQGMLNIMVFRAVSEGRLNAVPAHLQTVVPVVATGELRRRFQISAESPKISGDPTVIHWAGPKPWRWNTQVFSEPMDYFRRRAAREMKVPFATVPKASMIIDEFRAQLIPRVRARIQSRISRLWR